MLIETVPVQLAVYANHTSLLELAWQPASTKSAPAAQLLPSAAGTPWNRKFGEISTAIASGWMQIRGARRRRAVDRGFALSDHADWEGLRSAIRATGAQEVWVTHGYVAVMVRWLREQGLAARGLTTQFEGELEDDPQEVSGEASPEGFGKPA